VPRPVDRAGLTRPETQTEPVPDNRSKQAADLRIARILVRFDEIKEKAGSDDRGANLNDVLKAYGGATSDLRFKLDGDWITYWPKTKRVRTR
jgi:hypothetical protein